MNEQYDNSTLDGMAHIIGRLFVGNYSAACNIDQLRANNVLCVLGLAKECTPPEWSAEVGNDSNSTKATVDKDATYHYLPIDDSVNQSLTDVWQTAFSLIRDGVENGSNVLIHCKQGVSRSATITLGYMITHCEFTLREALDVMCSRKPDVGPNRSFFEQLQQLECRVNNLPEPSITLRDVLCERLLRMGFKATEAREALKNNADDYEQAFSALKSTTGRHRRTNSL